MYGLEVEDKKWQKYCWSDKAEKLWEKLSENVVGEHYYEKQLCGTPGNHAVFH